MMEGQSRAALFRYVIPGYVTVALVIFLLILYCPPNLIFLRNLLLSDNIFTQILNFGIISLVIGFLEGLIIIPLFDRIYEVFRPLIFRIKKNDESQTPHKHFITNILHHQIENLKNLGMPIKNTVKVNEDAIFDAYLNEKVSPLSIDRLFFLSDKRHMYFNSYKITLLILLVTFILLALNILLNNFMVVNTIVVFVILILTALSFKDLAKGVLKNLRCFEMTLLASKYSELNDFIFNALKGIIANNILGEKEGMDIRKAFIKYNALINEYEEKFHIKFQKQ